MKCVSFRDASWIAKNATTSSIALRRMLTERNSISSAAVMATCVIKISHGIHSQRNHLVLYTVSKKSLLIHWQLLYKFLN